MAEQFGGGRTEEISFPQQQEPTGTQCADNDNLRGPTEEVDTSCGGGKEKKIQLNREKKKRELAAGKTRARWRRIKL